MKRFGALSSSYDPEKLATTVKGILMGAIPVILFLTNAAGWAESINQESLRQLFEAVVQLIQVGGGLIAAAMTFWGLLRKTLIGLGVMKPKE